MTAVQAPAAEEILPAGADRELWLATRRGGVGGSDTSAILGVNDHSTAGRVWADKTGRAAPKDENESMLWGTLHEPTIRDQFTVRTGIEVVRTGTWRSLRWPWLLVNPDGLCSDGSGLEIKTTRSEFADQWEDGRIPAHAEVQAHHGMTVTGRSHWWVAGLIGGNRLLIRRVDRDEELVRVIVERTADFWDHVQLGVPPPGASSAEWLTVRDRHAVPDKTIQLDPDQAATLHAAYTAAKASADVDGGAMEAAKDAFRELLGDAEVATANGAVVATWKQNGAFDRAAFAAAHPQLAAEFTRPIPVLDTDRLATVHPELYRAYRGRKLLIKGA